MRWKELLMSLETIGECSTEPALLIQSQMSYTPPAMARAYHFANQVTGPVPLGDRLWSLVEINTHGCWLWKGHRQRWGYGTMRLNNRTVTVHRVAFFLSRGYYPAPPLRVLHT